MALTQGRAARLYLAPQPDNNKPAEGHLAGDKASVSWSEALRRASALPVKHLDVFS